MSELEVELEEVLIDHLRLGGFVFDEFTWKREAGLLTLAKGGVAVRDIEVFEPKPFFRRHFELRRWGKPFTAADFKAAVDAVPQVN